MKPVDLRGMTAIDAIGAAGALGADTKAAAQLYREWLQAHVGDPAAYAIEFNLGVLLKDLGDDNAAEAAYRRATVLNPGCLEAQFNLGSQLERLNRHQEAIDQWKSMLDLKRFTLPRDSRLYQMTLNNLGRIQENLKDYASAEAMLMRSLADNPEQPDVLHHLFYLRQKQCEWPVYAEIPGVSRDKMLLASGPMSVLAASDDPAVHLERMRGYAEEKIPQPEAVLSDGTMYGHKRLRVGYLSSDFCLHAVSMLTVELYELHDRSKFEVYGFCWSKDDGSDLRRRVVRAFDHYVQIGGMSDEAAARLIHSLEIDILVDLHGLTLGARPGILAWHPAPVQATYLGFPGTTGIPGVDYVLADRFVLPEETAKHFSEKPLYLPHCFQISDRSREIGLKPSRASCGLPEDAFVFCSFNNNYKFTPEIFAAWMRILKRVPGSVLWLLADNMWSEENLRRYAEAAGVGRERIIFAGRIAPSQYHARYQVADLFLDNRPYGAGTTANDALWAGLPLLTCPGRTFASRMAGSLLNALNLPELIAKDLDDYEEKAVFLGANPQELANLRSRLEIAKTSSVLFDIPQLVRDIEGAFIQVTGAKFSSDAANSSAAVVPQDRRKAADPKSPAKTIVTLIPAYKTKYIPQLLIALTSQTVKPDAVIVVDNSPDGMFKETLFSSENSNLLAKLNVDVRERLKTGVRGESLKNLVESIPERYDLIHVLRDEDVIYPDFYEKHRVAHHSGNFSCSISARWTATEDGQPYADLPIPDFVREHPNKMLSLDADIALLATMNGTKNWFGEFSNTVFNSYGFAALVESLLLKEFSQEPASLGVTLRASKLHPICYLQDHLGFSRNSDKIQTK